MLLLFTRKSWTLLLELLADSPSSRCLRVSQRRLLDEFHSIFCAKLTPVQFLDTGVDVPVVARLVYCRAENCGSSAVAGRRRIVQFLDKVVALPVIYTTGAVSRQGR